MELDANRIIAKLQDRLGQAFTTISILEARIEDLEAHMSALPKVDVSTDSDDVQRRVANIENLFTEDTSD